MTFAEIDDYEAEFLVDPPEIESNNNSNSKSVNRCEVESQMNVEDCLQQENKKPAGSAGQEEKEYKVLLSDTFSFIMMSRYPDLGDHCSKLEGCLLDTFMSVKKSVKKSFLEGEARSLNPAEANPDKPEQPGEAAKKDEASVPQFKNEEERIPENNAGIPEKTEEEATAPMDPKSNPDTPDQNEEASLYLQRGENNLEKSVDLKSIPSKIDETAVKEETSVDPEKDDPKNPEQTVDPDWMCLPFVLSSLVIFVQFFIYFVVLANFDSDEVPMGVDWTIRAAQVISLFITLYTQQDLIDGILLYTDGYDGLGSIGIEHMTIGKFYLSIFLRFFSGLVGIVAIFCLVIKSDEVVDLLLNFSAMQFVFVLDAVAFQLAKSGIWGQVLEAKARQVQSIKYVSKKEHYWQRKWPMLVLMVFLGIGLIVVYAMQSHRKYGDNDVYVQFDDKILPELPSYSGIYRGEYRKYKGMPKFAQEIGTVVYFPSETPKRDRSVLFVYCKDINKKDKKAWAFVGWDGKKVWDQSKQVFYSDSDPCENAEIFSNKDSTEVKETDEYNLLSHMSSPWFFDNNKKVAKMGIEFMTSKDLSMFSYFSSSLSCKFLKGSGKFEGKTFNLIPEHTEYITRAMRPIYKYKDETDDLKNRYVFFNGYRWVLAQNTEKIDLDEIAKHYSWYKLLPKNVELISDPMPLLSAEDTYFPTMDLKWYNPYGAHQPDRYDKSSTLSCQIDCKEDEVSMMVQIMTEKDYPTENFFVIFYNKTLPQGDFKHQSISRSITYQQSEYDIFQGGPFDQSNKLYTFRTCLNKTVTMFVLYDTFGDGMEGSFDITIDGNKNIKYTEEDLLVEFFCKTISIDLGAYTPSTDLADISKKTTDSCLDSLFDFGWDDSNLDDDGSNLDDDGSNWSL